MEYNERTLIVKIHNVSKEISGDNCEAECLVCKLKRHEKHAAALV